MSKSLGNEIVVSELLKRHHPETIRFFLLSTHYRRPIDYSEDRLVEIRKGLESFYRLFERYQRITGKSFFDLQAPRKQGDLLLQDGDPDMLKELASLRTMFLDHMEDDFNTGGAIGSLYEMIPPINRFADSKNLESASSQPADKEVFGRAMMILKELVQILGVFEKPQEKSSSEQDEVLGKVMELLIDLRAEARKNKNFALGDQIRNRLSDIGITLEDRKEGTLWRRG